LDSARHFLGKLARDQGDFDGVVMFQPRIETAACGHRV